MKRAHSPDSDEDSNSGKSIRGGSPTADIHCQCASGQLITMDAECDDPMIGRPLAQCVCDQCGPRTTSDTRQCTIQVHPIVGALFGVMMCEDCREFHGLMLKKTTFEKRKHGDCEKKRKHGECDHSHPTTQ